MGEAAANLLMGLRIALDRWHRRVGAGSVNVRFWRKADIVFLLLWQFSIPVLITNLIAWPVAYYYLHQWLEGYAYRIGLNPLFLSRRTSSRC